MHKKKSLNWTAGVFWRRTNQKPALRKQRDKAGSLSEIEEVS